MEHLALEVFDLTGSGSRYAFLPDDSSITITDTSEVFASGDVWSHSFTLNVQANAHILGTAGDMHGTRLHDIIDKRRARLWVEGLPLYLGYLQLDDEAEVDSSGNVDVTFQSGQKTFGDMIEGARANQVPMMGDVRFGVALWRKRWVSHTLRLSAYAAFGNTDQDGQSSDLGDVVVDGSRLVTFTEDGEDDGKAVQQYPRMVFPKGDFANDETGQTEHIDCLNTDYPYDDEHPYCNVPLCYQRSGYEKRMENGIVRPDYSSEPEAQRGYEYMPASRVNSAPNFYVIYWIRALMKHLGIYVEENQMMDVEDLRRLFFVNTRCEYREPKKMRGEDRDTAYGRYRFMDEGRLVAERIKPRGLVDIDKSKFKVSSFDVSGLEWSSGDYEHPTVDGIAVVVTGVEDWTDGQRERYEEENGYLHDAIATSDCFPDADISEVISALENGFGMRLLFSGDYRRVRIVLLRSIFRNAEVQDIQCDILSDAKVDNNVRGFRMTYGAGTDDTHFYYKGFADKLPHKKVLWPDDSDKHDYSRWVLDAEYADIINKVSAFDKTCYVTPATGNAHGIKVDKDAKRYDELHPSLFEYAGFMDAEDGDCTGEEETIHEVTVGFTPAIMNDLNMEKEREAAKPEDRRQRFALFLDETMRPRRPDLGDLAAPESYDDPDAIYSTDELYAKHGPGSDSPMTGDDGIVKPGEFAITSDMYGERKGVTAVIPEGFVWHGKGGIAFWHSDFTVIFDMEGCVNEGYRLYLQDNYEPNDDGICPIETHDWGLMLGIMRGSGSDAYVNYWNDPDDKENDTWEIQAGSSVTSHPDTCDSYGSEWDYDGSQHVTPQTAGARLLELFPDSDAPFSDQTLGYITGTRWLYVRDADGQRHAVLLASEYSKAGTTVTGGAGDIRYFAGLTLEELVAVSRGGRHMVIETDSSQERGDTLVQLCRLAYGGGTETMAIDNGVGSRYGRFSLKLRAEKPNPYFDPTQPENSYNRRYLTIDNENLRGRGLADQFYKEYSYWVRNARIARRTVRMGLAQLLAIDKTKRVKVGDITGFIRKMQYTVDKEKGLGNVTMEIMYI